MTIAEIKTLIKRGDIRSEMELEAALSADRSLRKLSKTNPDVSSLRSALRTLIQRYENKNWSDIDEITTDQIERSDIAEEAIEKQRSFAQMRKNLIKHALKSKGLTQQDLGRILGHPNKSYMSQLMNGLVAFQMNDLILIHSILDIKLDQLIPTTLPEEKILKAIDEIRDLNNPELDENKVLALL